ncbi:hypothetical protein SO694_00005310 [Aureococcus anophagefferens]|uniref:Uncharacterized protein n=1 Tax=Aureococcus anophagefferens TaxID=44056 RepID=A0ABR1G9Y3_AURAN
MLCGPCDACCGADQGAAAKRGSVTRAYLMQVMQSKDHSRAGGARALSAGAQFHGAPPRPAAATLCGGACDFDGPPKVAKNSFYESPYTQWSESTRAAVLEKRDASLELRKQFLQMKRLATEKGGARSQTQKTLLAKKAFRDYVDAVRAGCRALGVSPAGLSDDDLDGVHPRVREHDVEHLVHKHALQRAQAGHHHPPTAAELLHLRRDSSSGLDRVDALGGGRLHWALHDWSRDADRGEGHDDLVVALIVAGVDLDVENDEHLCPLLIAIKVGNTLAVCALLHAGASFGVTNAQGYGPLLLAAEMGQANAFSLLAEKLHEVGALAEYARRTGDGYSCLHFACVNDDAVLLRVALGRDEFKAILDLRSPRSDKDATASDLAFLGQAPLHKCVVYGHGRCADLLLDAGADPDLPDARGRAPLHCAAAGERPDLVVLLLRRGADATRKDAKGRTPDGVLPPADRRTGKAKATMQLLLDAQVAAARDPPKKRTPKWRRR